MGGAFSLSQEIEERKAASHERMLATIPRVTISELCDPAKANVSPPAHSSSSPHTALRLHRRRAYWETSSTSSQIFDSQPATSF